MIGEDYTKWLIDSTGLINYNKLLFILPKPSFIGGWYWMRIEHVPGSV